MTVTTETARNTYVGTGLLDTYDYSFKILDASHLRVIVVDTDGGESVLELDVDYSVDGVGEESGGEIVLLGGALAADYGLTIRNYPPLTQLTDIISQGRFNAKTHQDVWDLTTLQIQRLVDDLNRTIRYPESEDGSSDRTLPTTAQRSSKFAGWDADGNWTTLDGDVTGVAVETVTQVVDTIAGLKALAVPSSAVTYFVRGYYAVGDGGGGTFRWRAGDATADDGGLTIAPDVGTGRWNRIYSGVKDIRWFGATGDGATDDHAAIIAAATAGSHLYFPAGTYLTSALTISANNVCFQLHPQAIIKLKNGQDTDAITASGTNFRWMGGKIDGNKANQSSGDGLVLTSTGARIVDLLVQDVERYGVHGYGASALLLDEVRSVDSGSVGIFVETNAANISDIRIIGSSVDRSSISAGSIVEGGIKVHGSEHLAGYTVSDVKIEGCKAYLPTSPTDATCIGIELWGGVYRGKVIGCDTSGGNMGISYSRTYDSTGIGNTTYNAATVGFELSNCAHCTVGKNIIQANGLTVTGVVVSGATGLDLSITGNEITGTQGTTGGGIKSSPTTSLLGFSIVGNVLKDCHNYSISLLNSRRGTISGNDVRGDGANSKKGVFLSASYDVAVTGNYISDMTETGVYIVASTAITVDHITIAGNTFNTVNVEIGAALSGGAAFGTHCSIGNNGIPARSKVANYTVTIADEVINSDATSGANTQTLPTTNVPPGKTYLIRKIDSSGNAVTVGATVDGAASPTLAAQFDFMRVVFNGTNYYEA
jgi:hypothetical protein